MNKHTIVLVQYTPDLRSRTFMDYEAVNQAVEGICGMYEQVLRQQHPNRADFTYDLTSLYAYIDKLTDMSCMVYEPSVNAYIPYNKEWIKKRIYDHLKKQAA
eukprot:TRINITY_DN468_c0_g1_i1.p2 TRINITY_DN468_c0_g1~~TRINITY_DN468_c0_g1_i1.p2  ORF type:complete len:102 (-),score=27.18 TRINITY_DN468_c0_g1_i1:232-537(-)